MVNKTIVDGKVAVLVSPGFGAGWSTWNREHAAFMLFDSKLVEFAQSNAPEAEVEEYLQEALGTDTYIYTGGWDDIVIAWLEEGTRFEIHEYDGSETIRRLSPDDGFVA